MEVSSPGKVLMLGGYAVLDYHPAYSVAVEDEEGKGVVASAALGERRIISEQFNMDVCPEAPDTPPTAAYLVAEQFLKSYGGEDTTVKLKNSPIFGEDEEKSGLGSSSASIVSTIAAMFEANGLSIEEHRDTIHLLSQVANAIYSKKIGSGYDIASATYGSIVYTRFSPSALERLSIDNVEEILRRKWEPMIVQRLAPPWEIAVFNIRRKKTSTISAVKLFKKAKELHKEEVEEALREQTKAEKEALKHMEDRNAEGFRSAMHRAREAHRKLSEIMQRVDPNFEGIEPTPLTKVIAEAEKIEGVIAGRCHGGGGWDGVAFFVEKGARVAEEIIKTAEEIELVKLNVKVNIRGVELASRKGFW